MRASAAVRGCKGLRCEIGKRQYLTPNSDNGQADALFTVIAARHLRRSTMITTQASFGQWHQVFPNAACVHKLIDLLTHVSEVIEIKGESFRLREATERKARLEVERAQSRHAAAQR